MDWLLVDTPPPNVPGSANDRGPRCISNERAGLPSPREELRRSNVLTVTPFEHASTS